MKPQLRFIFLPRIWPVFSAKEAEIEYFCFCVYAMSGREKTASFCCIGLKIDMKNTDAKGRGDATTNFINRIRLMGHRFSLVLQCSRA